MSVLKVLRTKDQASIQQISELTMKNSELKKENSELRKKNSELSKENSKLKNQNSDLSNFKVATLQSNKNVASTLDQHKELKASNLALQHQLQETRSKLEWTSEKLEAQHDKLLHIEGAEAEDSLELEPRRVISTGARLFIYNCYAANLSPNQVLSLTTSQLPGENISASTIRRVRKEFSIAVNCSTDHGCLPGVSRRCKTYFLAYCLLAIPAFFILCQLNLLI